MGARIYRVGQIVPSSNTTMETEVPRFMQRLSAGNRDIDLTFHSARMRMKQVKKEDLVAMDADSHRCARELSDAPIDVAGYACLVAIMAMGLGYHQVSEETLMRITAEEGRKIPIVTSAGALISELKLANYRRLALLMPYSDELAKLVVNYLENEGLEIADYRNFSVTNNLEVGCIPAERLIGALDGLDTRNIDAIVLSACVQMPSIAALDEARKRTGLPVTSTAECTAKAMLRTIGVSFQDDFAVA